MYTMLLTSLTIQHTVYILSLPTYTCPRTIRRYVAKSQGRRRHVGWYQLGRKRRFHKPYKNSKLLNNFLFVDLSIYFSSCEIQKIRNQKRFFKNSKFKLNTECNKHTFLRLNSICWTFYT